MDATRRHDTMLGRVLLGRYRIVKELARGGMGVVYLARSEGAEGFLKPVVIKLILGEYASEDRYTKMFAREARILATLRDPSIVDVIEFGEDSGDYVMVLEYVRGYHLGQWKNYLSLLGRVVPTDIIVQIVIDILSALHHAHTAKHPDGQSMHIAHRDVSPSNILLDINGRARLLDFGVARMRGGSIAYKTQVKSVVGKLPYLAPELLTGEDATAKTDLYSCAVILHETVLGRNVFRGSNEAMTLYRVVQHVPEPVATSRPDVPDGLDDVLAKALSKSADERYESAAAFAKALRVLQGDAEHEIRERLAALLEQDFTEEMASALGIESLAAHDDAWRRLSLLPAASGVASNPVPEAQALPPPAGVPEFEDDGPSVTAISGGSGGAVGPEGPQGNARRMITTSVMPSAVYPEPEPGRSGHSVATWGFTIAAVCAMLGGAGFFYISRPAATAPQIPQAPVQVVQQPNPSTAPPALAEQPREAGTPDAAAEPEPEEEEPETRRAKGPSRRRRPAGPDPAALTRAFRRRQPAIQRCVVQHGESVQAGTRAEVEFNLSGDGRLISAKVLPPSVAATELGKCVAKAARATKFPGQGQPVVFAIPVSTRLVR